MWIKILPMKAKCFALTILSTALIVDGLEIILERSEYVRDKIEKQN